MTEKCSDREPFSVTHQCDGRTDGQTSLKQRRANCLRCLSVYVLSVCL